MERRTRSERVGKEGETARDMQVESAPDPAYAHDSPTTCQCSVEEEEYNLEKHDRSKTDVKLKFGLGTEISPRRSGAGGGTAKAESKSVRPPARLLPPAMRRARARFLTILA